MDIGDVTSDEPWGLAFVITPGTEVLALLDGEDAFSRPGVHATELAVGSDARHADGAGSLGEVLMRPMGMESVDLVSGLDDRRERGQSTMLQRAISPVLEGLSCCECCVRCAVLCWLC